MISVTFSIGKINKSGNAPVFMWLNLDGKRKVMQLPVKVAPTEFRKLINSKQTNDVQVICNKYKNMVFEYANKCLIAGEKIELQNCIYYCTGVQIKKNYTVENMVNDFLNVESKKVDVEITLKSYQRYLRVVKLFYEVVDKNKPVAEITNNDIVLYRQYLLGKCKYEQSTMCNCLKRMKSIFGWALTNDKISKNPFLDMKTSCKSKEVTPLTKDELEMIEKVELVNVGLKKVRDCFLFSCYTGLSFIDLTNLTKDDIMQKNGITFIKSSRQKTDVEYIIPLSEKAIELLEKHNYKMPVMSNQKTNQYLKTIGDCAGVSQSLHFHLARHTALTMMLENGIPLEVVSKIAGHTNIKQTQHYAKIVENRVLSFAGLM